MIQLMQHQSRFAEIVAQQPRFAWYAEPGCGKTIGVLSVINADRIKTLVLAPLSILHCAWANDAKHFDLRCVVCWSDKPAERRRLIASDADVLVTNYETFKKNRDDFLAAGVRRLVVDESSKIKGHNTQISKACHAFADQMDSVILLSGTPAPNCPTEYWSQYRTLDRRIFGESFYRFANKYFYPIKRTINGFDRVIGWRMIGDAPAIGTAWATAHREHPTKSEFMDKLKSASWALRKSECLDLPPTTDVIREVELSAPERRAYDEMKNQLRIELSDGRTLNAAMQARAMKLRQITGGAVLVEHQAQFIGDSKLNELSELLEELGDRQVVIFAEFTHEIDRITSLCPGSATIDGRAGVQYRTQAIERFQNGHLQYLICHPAAAGHGITLTAANHAIFFSLCDPPEYYTQSKARLDRKGQSSPVTFWHLIGKDTIDERRLARLQNKQDASGAIFDELGLTNRELATA